MSSKELAAAAAQFALNKKAEDVVILDLRKLSPIADFFVICSGQSEVQVRAIANSIEDACLELPEKAKPWHVEGNDTLRWVLLDYVNIVVHVFRNETREYYSLEKFWGDAPRELIVDESPLPGSGE
ncbi:MAG: ribosome silencing factor [bacterium]|nr:ribosome silencing factor [bacterium]